MDAFDYMSNTWLWRKPVVLMKSVSSKSEPQTQNHLPVLANCDWERMFKTFLSLWTTTVWAKILLDYSAAMLTGAQSADEISRRWNFGLYVSLHLNRRSRNWRWLEGSKTLVKKN